MLNMCLFIQLMIFYTDHCDNIVLDLLSRLLFPRGFGKNLVFIKDFKVSTIVIIQQLNTIILYVLRTATLMWILKLSK